LYFGSNPDNLSACIERAYRDFNRTLHGVAHIVEKKPEVHDRASAQVRSFLTGLADITDQTAFDNWHRTACAELSRIYSEAGYKDFHAGQAQKWLNMALKYILVFGEERVPGYAHVFELAHAPLDNIILDRFSRYGLRKLTTAWSRLSYEEYMGVQLWLRSSFPDSPLAVEFALYLFEEDAA
jgi:hypothetical protein